jgi:hypothetical protein
VDYNAFHSMRLGHDQRLAASELNSVACNEVLELSSEQYEFPVYGPILIPYGYQGVGGARSTSNQG